MNKDSPAAAKLIEDIMACRELTFYIKGYAIRGIRRMDSRHKIVAPDLNKAFAWRGTPEGSQFWYAIYRILTYTEPPDILWLDSLVMQYNAGEDRPD